MPLVLWCRDGAGCLLLLHQPSVHVRLRVPGLHQSVPPPWGEGSLPDLYGLPHTVCTHSHWQLGPQPSLHEASSEAPSI